MRKEVFYFVSLPPVEKTTNNCAHPSKNCVLILKQVLFENMISKCNSSRKQYTIFKNFKILPVDLCLLKCKNLINLFEILVL